MIVHKAGSRPWGQPRILELTVLPSRPYLICSLAVHAVVVGAAIAIAGPSVSRILEAEPVEVTQTTSRLLEREPPVEEPETREEETEIEENDEEVLLEDPEIQEPPLEEPEAPLEEMREWTPPPAPENWLVKVVPREPEPPPEPPVELPPVEIVEASAPPPPPPVIEAIEGQNPSPEYPAIAVRRGWEGDVLLDVEVDQVGEVLECAVARSSGFPVLDSAAEVAVRNWRFRHGPGTTRVRIEFLLSGTGIR